jgi:integral membrane protein
MLHSPLRRLRWIALLEGLSYLVLLGIAMPLKYLADSPEAVRIVGTVHGGLFILLIASVIEVTLRRPWWSPTFWLASAVASIVPLGTFVLDRWLKRVEAEDAARQPIPAL